MNYPSYITDQYNFQEITTLKAKVEAMMSELEQAKQEASTAIKDKLQIKLESDNKVKVRQTVYTTLTHTHLLLTELYNQSNT